MSESIAKTNFNPVEQPITKYDDDLLGMKSFIDGLVSYIIEAPTPTTIAIQGPWGSGKTSLINAVRDKLCEHSSNDQCDKSNHSDSANTHHEASETSTSESNQSNDDSDKRFYSISVNVWEHSMLSSPEDTVISIMRCILNEIDKLVDDQSGFLERAKDFLSHGVYIKKWVTSVATNGASYLATSHGNVLLGCVVKKIGKALIQFFDKQAAEADKFIPANFRKSLNEVIDNFIQKKSPNKRFIIFIDDLDRIAPKQAIQILEMLKNFFDVDHCIFVLAIDQNVALKGLKAKYGKREQFNEDTYQSFFDKIIQVTAHLPTAYYNIDAYLTKALLQIGYSSEAAINDGLSKFSLHGKLKSFHDALIEITRLSVGSNPRAIKRLVSNLSLIKHIHASTNSNKDEVINRDALERLIIYAFVCIQIAYPQIYELLRRSPVFIYWLEETASAFGCNDYKKYYKPDWLENDLLNSNTVALSSTTYNKVYQAIIASFCYASNSENLKKHVSDIAQLLNMIEDLSNESGFGTGSGTDAAAGTSSGSGTTTSTGSGSYSGPDAATGTDAATSTDSKLYVRSKILKNLLQVSSATTESTLVMNNDGDANDHEESHLIKRFWHDLLFYGHMSPDYMNSYQSYQINTNHELSIPMKIEIDGVTKVPCSIHLKVLGQPTQLSVEIDFSDNKYSPLHASDRYIQNNEMNIKSWMILSTADDSNIEKFQKSFDINLAKPSQWRTIFDELFPFIIMLRKEIPIIHQTYNQPSK